MSRRIPERSALLAGLLVTLLLSGCTQWRYELGTQLTAQALQDAEPGLSLGAVLDRLGPPQRLSATSNGYILAWEFWQIREDTVGLSLGALGTDLLSLDWGKAHLHGEFLLVTFNRQHEVTSSTFARWSNEAGSGQAIQPMLGLVSLVDVEDMVGQMPHHQWGATMLKPMPQAINSASRPDMGQSGIQRRGTPTGTGQQSLEND